MSWHWEEVNYTTEAKKILKQSCDTFKYSEQDAAVYFRDVIVDGEASISLRRGRAIPTCTFVLFMQWFGVLNEGSSSSISGSLRISDYDVETRGLEDVSLQVTIAQDDAFHQRLRRILCEKVVPSLLKVLDAQFLIPFKTRYAAESLERQQRQQSAFPAVEPESLSANQTISQSGTVLEGNELAQSANKPEVTSLNHNLTKHSSSTSSSHWNERTLTSSSLAELKQVLVNCSGNIKCLNESCALELFDVNASGEAAVTTRREKQFVIFEFVLHASWRAIARTQPQGVFMADAKGSLTVNNFSSEDLDSLYVDFCCDEASHPARKRIYDAVKTECGAQLCDILRSFAQQLGSF